MNNPCLEHIFFLFVPIWLLIYQHGAYDKKICSNLEWWLYVKVILDHTKTLLLLEHINIYSPFNPIWLLLHIDRPFVLMVCSDFEASQCEGYSRFLYNQFHPVDYFPFASFCSVEQKCLSVRGILRLN